MTAYNILSILVRSGRSVDAYRVTANLPPNARDIMRMRYISGLRWREIGEITYYSKEGLMKIHRKAIQYIEEKCGEGAQSPTFDATDGTCTLKTL